MRITNSEHDFLKQLIIDCDIYNLSERESLQYIEARYSKSISRRTYFYYRKNLKKDNEVGVNIWLEHQSRIGFAIHHQKLTTSLEKSFNDTTIPLLIETEKPYDNRDENKILKLKAEQRDSGKLLMELALGTPIVDKIRRAMMENDNKNKYCVLKERIEELS